MFILDANENQSKNQSKNISLSTTTIELKSLKAIVVLRVKLVHRLPSPSNVFVKARSIVLEN